MNADSSTSTHNSRDVVQTIAWCDAIRRRPLMYLGDLGVDGLHVLVEQLLENSLNHDLGARITCRNVYVEMHSDGSLSVRDDGSTMPLGIHPKLGRPILEVLFTECGAGPIRVGNKTFGSSSLPGVQLPVVSALAEWAVADIRVDGKVYRQRFERGRISGPVTEIGVANDTGTTITFKPDPEIFGRVTFDAALLEDRLRELAFLTKGVAFHFADHRTNRRQTFDFPKGVAEFVEYLNYPEGGIHKVLHVERENRGIHVEAALQYTAGTVPRIHAYANGVANPAGGTHIDGLNLALLRRMTGFGQSRKGLTFECFPFVEECTAGLTAVVSVELEEPQFESQKRLRMNNGRADFAVATVVVDLIRDFFFEDSPEAERVLNKVVAAAHARAASSFAPVILLRNDHAKSNSPSTPESMRNRDGNKEK